MIFLAVALLVMPVASCVSECDCSNSPDLIVSTGAPVTQVTVSGPACDGSMFGCLRNGLDNTIHPDCTLVQVLAKAEGECVVDLITADGSAFTVRRQFVRTPPGGCCGGGLTAANHDGYVDLHNSADAGSD